MFISPPLAMFRGLPLNVPPDQLNNPLIVTELDKLIVPLVTLMVSLGPGTPTGIQLFAVNQSPEAAVQVKVAAEHQPVFSKSDRQNRGGRIAKEICRFIQNCAQVQQIPCFMIVG
jgi:hypothetical protein